ncbi:MAG: c-type cytochrome, partial [Candidatus Puniceispirillales bacterium]
AAADVISDRKAGFKGNVKALKAIQAAMSSGDMETIAASARSVADWSARMTDYFPEGSDTGDTNARAEIWFDFDDFTLKAKDAENAALALASLAEAGQQDQIMDGLKTLSGTCKACHSSYKN